MKRLIFVGAIALSLSLCLLPFAFCLVHADWPMLAANPERTSWVAEEVKGNLNPAWYRPIEPYINPKTQIIAAEGKLFISTARGLYCFDAANGNVLWVYPTELPLGHSPTHHNGILYVGGYDRRIHAIDANTGNLKSGWSFFEAEAGFETNPLVVDGSVYAGCRDGYFYALDANTGSLKWRFQTEGPIVFSPAHKDGVLYFASNDAHAYAVSVNGLAIWKSAKLSGAGFHSYWPVIYKEYVVFAGSENYRMEGINYEQNAYGGRMNMMQIDRDVLWPEHPAENTLLGATGNEPGDWVSGTVTMNASRAVEYLEQKPWRRTYFVLRRSNGTEYTFDSDNDGNPEYMPITACGATHSGNRYPPVIGSDGVLYQSNMYVYLSGIARGHVSGWKFGTKYISRIAGSSAADEPMAAAVGGNVIYTTLCCHRSASSYDISKPYGTDNRSWAYFSYNLAAKCPGYNVRYYADNNDGWGLFGGINGIYGMHGLQNPPVPYQNKIYMLKGNCVIAWSATGAASSSLPLAATVNILNANPVTFEMVKAALEREIQKMVDAGHLRPGFFNTGMKDPHINNGYYFSDYFHNPAFTLQVLTRALPHLSSALQQQAKQYVQSWFNKVPPYQYTHSGWKDLAPREVSVMPPEHLSAANGFGPKTGPGMNYPQDKFLWDFPQHSFYGAWKYAQVFGNAKSIFDQMKSKLESPPSNAFLLEYPLIHNAFIAGHLGYLELEKLAGYSQSNNVKAEYDRLLILRATQFSKDTPYTGNNPEDGNSLYDYPGVIGYNRKFNICRNFTFLVPELGDFLHDNAFAKVKEAVAEYNTIAPCWFVSKYDAGSGEAVFSPLFNYHSVFQAKAHILKEPFEELAKYIDVPAFHVGDLFYIDNLVSLLEANEPLPRITGPHYILAEPNQPFGRRIEYVNPLGGQASLTLSCPDSWIIALGDSIWGHAPATSGITGQVQVILTVDGKAWDTVDVQVMVSHTVGMEDNRRRSVLNPFGLHASYLPCHGIQFHANLPKSGFYRLEVFDITGKQVWQMIHNASNPGRQPVIRTTAIGNNSILFAHLKQGTKQVVGKIVKVK